MQQDLVRYSLADGVAALTLDDGKRNALSPEMLRALNAAVDRAERDEAAIILTGREEVFSAGFDLKVMRRGGSQTVRMLQAGYAMTARLLEYPYPVVAACNGHAIAMGLFLMLSADYRVGLLGQYKFVANEVALGLPLPRAVEAVMRLRLTPSAFQRAAALSEEFDPQGAVDAGILDRAVEKEELTEVAQAKAQELLRLDARAHRITKRQVRRATIRRIRRSIPADLKDAVVLGVQMMIKARRS
jgi:enoyl-CoA hydratase